MGDVDGGNRFLPRLQTDADCMTVLPLYTSCVTILLAQDTHTHTHTQQSMVCLCGQSYLDYASRAENFVIRKFSGLQAST